MRERNLRILVLTILLLVSVGASDSLAKIITVDCNGPSDFNSIQEAIGNADYYDTIVVHPGIYYENINFYGKWITVTSKNPNDVNVVDATVIDGNGVGDVVTFDNLEINGSVLLGLTIQNGERGIYCYFSDPLIRKCVLTANDSGIVGSSASPTILESIIEKNNSSGISACNGQISKCIVRENGGDGLYNCQGELLNCIVTANGGKGVYYNSAHGRVTNCTIVGNKGVGVAADGYSTVGVSNSIIVKNEGYGLSRSSGAGLTSNYNNVYINNPDYGQVSVGPKDISENPLFADPGHWEGSNWVNGDYHLRSTLGRWNPETKTWVTDVVNSSSIDAGDPYSPIGLEPYPNGLRINQGAYGGTEQASKSPGPLCTEYLPMDFTGDCKVDFKDFALFTRSWLECNLDPPEACWP